MLVPKGFHVWVKNTSRFLRKTDVVLARNVLHKWEQWRIWLEEYPHLDKAMPFKDLEIIGVEIQLSNTPVSERILLDDYFVKALQRRFGAGDEEEEFDLEVGDASDQQNLLIGAGEKEEFDWDVVDIGDASDQQNFPIGDGAKAKEEFDWDVFDIGDASDQQNLTTGAGENEEFDWDVVDIGDARDQQNLTTGDGAKEEFDLIVVDIGDAGNQQNFPLGDGDKEEFDWDVVASHQPQIEIPLRSMTPPENSTRAIISKNKMGSISFASQSENALGYVNPNPVEISTGSITLGGSRSTSSIIEEPSSTPTPRKEREPNPFDLLNLDFKF